MLWTSLELQKMVSPQFIFGFSNWDKKRIFFLRQKEEKKVLETLLKWTSRAFVFLANAGFASTPSCKNPYINNTGGFGCLITRVHLCRLFNNSYANGSECFIANSQMPPQTLSNLSMNNPTNEVWHYAKISSS